MYYETKGEKFIDDPGYVAECIIAASSELPCPSCLTGLMQVVVLHPKVVDALPCRFDAFQCQSCERRVLIERFAEQDEPPDFRQALGAIPLKPGMPTATEAIRKARDEA